MTLDELYSNQDGLNGGFFKKNFRLKNVSLKNVVKVAKVAVPIVTSMVPVVGGTVGGLVNKALTNKSGTANLVGRIANTAVKVSKTKVGKVVTNAVKKQINPSAPVAVEPVNQLVPASFATDTTYQAQNTTETSTAEPVGELTPVKEVASVAKAAILPLTEEKKSNTMLWVIGGVVVAGGIYLATKKD